ncbi:MAG: class I SAM-dependent methyltransferase, partial [bacterium]
MKEQKDFKNSVERFFGRVENYIKYRPHYPKEIIDFLRKEIELDRSKVIADIGSGPGISCEHFIEYGNKVFAVEPNKHMKNGAEKIFAGSKNFISINGTAEDTTLRSKTADLIISGQAFHWFDKVKCKVEFQRILKSDGYVMLMWNLRDRKSGFMNEYEELLIEYGKDYANLYQDDVDAEEIANFFYPVINKVKTFSNFQFLNYEALEGRMLSSSYIPLKENPLYDKMIIDLKNIFEKNNKEGKVW